MEPINPLPLPFTSVYPFLFLIPRWYQPTSLKCWYIYLACSNLAAGIMQPHAPHCLLLPSTWSTSLLQDVSLSIAYFSFTFAAHSARPFLALQLSISLLLQVSCAHCCKGLLSQSYGQHCEDRVGQHCSGSTMEGSSSAVRAWGRGLFLPGVAACFSFAIALPGFPTLLGRAMLVCKGKSGF